MPTNEQLNVLPAHKDKRCEICGRQYPQTILNIEGFLHHDAALICVDRKSCERLKRKHKAKE